MKQKGSKHHLYILGIIFIILPIIYFIMTNINWKQNTYAYTVTELFQTNTGLTIDLSTNITKSQTEELNKYAIDSQKDDSNLKISSSQLMAESKSVAIDNGVCENAQDPVSVCVNYDSCCTATDNCVCQNPINKDCQEIYNNCLKDQYLSKSTMDYISAEKKDVICKKIKANCCKSVLETKKAKATDYKQVTMHMPDIDSQILCGFNGNDQTALSACKQSCNLNDKCKAIVYNKAMGRCDIYNKPLIQKPGFIRNKTDTETIQLQKTQSPVYKKTNKTMATIEPFQNMTAESYCYNTGIEPNNNGSNGFNSVNGIPPTLNSKNSGQTACYKNNTIVKDCRNQYDKCISRSLPGLTDTKKKEHCALMYGSCCSIVDGLDVTDRFKFLDVEIGAGNPKNKLCSPVVKTLDDCKKHCLADPGCMYIYSNLGIPGIETNGNERCDLYSGKPVTGFIPTFGKKDDRFGGKFIYKKAEIDLDEEIEETTTTTTTTTPPTKIEN